MQRSGAAAVVIGNEILSAKVSDLNGSLLIKQLRERGIPLRSLAVVPDEVDAIVESLVVARRRAAYVFTSGGIGPTHDDVTVRAVALALGRRVVRLMQVVDLVKKHYGPRASAEAMRLADAPEGSELIFQEGVWYPVLACDGVFMLPGVPQLFKLQLQTVLSRLDGSPVFLKCLYLSAGEAEIARVLDQVALALPQVAIGSYPTFDRDAGYKVKVTVEHQAEQPVIEALARLQQGLPPGSILRVE